MPVLGQFHLRDRQRPVRSGDQPVDGRSLSQPEDPLPEHPPRRLAGRAGARRPDQQDVPWQRRLDHRVEVGNRAGILPGPDPVLRHGGPEEPVPAIRGEQVGCFLRADAGRVGVTDPAVPVPVARLCRLRGTGNRFLDPGNHRSNPLRAGTNPVRLGIDPDVRPEVLCRADCRENQPDRVVAHQCRHRSDRPGADWNGQWYRDDLDRSDRVCPGQDVLLANDAGRRRRTFPARGCRHHGHAGWHRHALGRIPRCSRDRLQAGLLCVKTTGIHGG